ncbi:Sialyltransferase-like protein 2 [Rhynchospora pubera]|uniref:Sialyltransferase-like protein 2 n=1 Tax=Rhynchospora pubera TaxID=906938 RepID=A0AAV8DJF7_9POAL|nr:Sialyltransferase-like protein 2 [Rhynchospora pubera]
MMKRPLRSLPLPLLFLFLLACLAFRSALTRSSHYQSTPQDRNIHGDATLLALSSHDPADSSLRTDISDLLHASLESFDTIGGKFRTLSLWRRIGSDDNVRPRSLARIRLPVRAQTHYPPDRQLILPLFRHSLVTWARSHHAELPYSIMSELMQLVKRPIEIFNGNRDSGEPYGSCAVVGNSGILLGSNHGELINSHQFVIRLNNARVVGYERDVGSKTSLSFVNSNILHLCTRRVGCHCHPYGENVPIAMYMCQPRHFLDYVVCNSSHKAPLLITDPRFDNLCAQITKYYSLKRFADLTGLSPTRWNETHDATTFHYSSGFQAVMLALGICKRVSVFGFGKIKGAKHHYYTNQKAELNLHDYEAEYMIYRDLIKQPEVIPFLSGFQVPPLVFYY